MSLPALALAQSARTTYREARRKLAPVVSKILAFPAREEEKPAPVEKIEPEELTEAQISHVRAIVDKEDRSGLIKIIRDALKKRSGKAWSVTGGKGTSWGWIRVEAPPARKTAHCFLKDGAVTTWPDDYEMRDTGEPGGAMTQADCEELSVLMAEKCWRDGMNIPPQSDFQRVAVAGALYGITSPFTASPNWD